MVPENALIVPISLPGNEPEARMAPALADQWMALRRRWRMIAVIALLVPCLAGATLSLMPARYTAMGILLYDPGNAAPPGTALEAGGANAPDEDAITASKSAIISSLPAAAVKGCV